MRVSQSLKLSDTVKRDEPLACDGAVLVAVVVEKNDQLEHEVLPKISYKLEVDGRLKSEHPTQEAALTVALELKRKFPKFESLSSMLRGRRVLQWSCLCQLGERL